MSLYGDDLMETNKDGSVKGTWSDSIKLLQGSIHAKKFHQQQQTNKGSVAPVADLRRKRAPVLPRHPNAEVTFNSITGKMELRDSNYQPVPDLSGPPPAVTALIQNITSSISVFGYNDEYDPAKPNDYEKLKEQQKRESERQRRDEEELQPVRGLYDDDSNHSDDQLNTSRESSVRKGNVFAPPPSLIEEDKRASVNNQNEIPSKDEYPLTPERNDEMEIESRPSNLASGATKGAIAAAKMMAKMGYREGQGLGKFQQGMSSALAVEKTSKRGGKILHEKDITTKEPILPPPPTVTTKIEPNVGISVELKNATKVVLLKNMVGPGEVDDLLDSETKEECQKYGEVEKCLIYEIPDAPEDEAVRIFVEFKRVESAIKAFVAMNGRYFGGRVVKGKFYDLDKFRQFDLADDS